MPIRPPIGTDQAGEKRHPEGPHPRIFLAEQGDPDRQALGKFCSPIPMASVMPLAMSWPPKPDSHRQPFRKIVERDGDDEQPDAPQRRAGRLAVRSHD